MSAPLAAYEPTPAAALAQLAAVDPAAYARTRSHLDGAVTGLGPYVTHGFLSLPQVREHVVARHHLRADHKLIFELAWREYFRHVWAHEGEDILTSLHVGPLPDAAYARELPADVRQARTGVSAVDAAVRQLYATGTLHNHARMWLASYTVHLRKVHWRAGADWMLAHLLDVDVHARWPWSTKRWDFVAARLVHAATLRSSAPARDLVAALGAARSVHGVDNPHLSPALRALPLTPAPRLFDARDDVPSDAHVDVDVRSRTRPRSDAGAQ